MHAKSDASALNKDSTKESNRAGGLKPSHGNTKRFFRDLIIAILAGGIVALSGGKEAHEEQWPIEPNTNFSVYLVSGKTKV